MLLPAVSGCFISDMSMLVDIGVRGDGVCDEAPESVVSRGVVGEDDMVSTDCRTPPRRRPVFGKEFGFAAKKGLCSSLKCEM